MKFKIFICISLLSCMNLSYGQATEQTDRVITLFVREYPEVTTKPKNDIQQNQLFCNILTDNFMIKCNLLQLPFNFGIFAIYYGFFTLTDQTGLITYPGQTQKESINILVSDDISPVFLLKNTIGFWEFNNPFSRMYSFTRKKDDETGIYFWDVSEKKLPQNKRIPLNTIIIVSDPDSIEIPEGITPTTKSVNMILPDIYAKKGANYIENALFMLTIRPFFSMIKNLYKERPSGYMRHIN